jgi:prepilin-type N-terminal cleavage/methylation domain-containing protein
VRRAFSLIEVLAVIVIMGVMAVLIVPRFGGQTSNAKKNACAVQKGNIEVQAQLWYRNKGSWPAADLADIGADPQYFPDGLPSCPVDGSSYEFDGSRAQATGHSH